MMSGQNVKLTPQTNNDESIIDITRAIHHSYQESE